MNGEDDLCKLNLEMNDWKLFGFVRRPSLALVENKLKKSQVIFIYINKHDKSIYIYSVPAYQLIERGSRFSEPIQQDFLLQWFIVVVVVVVLNS